ncbi:MAG: CBS domain-containing protein [Rhodospirillaceae bacterium]|nr:CBS domain-containing protein [Rhodospirillaceae bacterium]MBT5242678.1 CBS domain-containing protein [Rhodospirillaceae bacterium]MBT5561491.1 CBS domain-containing protein [Rhodospirillaceae bacterium]MBT6241911.1 CBS domain-containing protein [Rhodospirillaceae bacterium]MBT7138712.1 CBS domain-containing protein [Rhodospirillaceae bacterium]
MRSQTAIFSKLVRDFMRQAPLVLGPSNPVSEAIEAMREARVSSVVVTDAQGMVVGIVTEQDISRRVAFQVPGDTPLAQVMTTPVMSISSDDYLFRAIARMRRYDLKHMPVVDEDGNPMGMIDLHDAMAVTNEKMMGQIDQLTHRGSIDGLKKVKQAQVDLARELLDDNLPASEVQALLTHVNNLIYRRVIDACLADMESEGLGAPPVKFAAIVFGSGGRGENYLFPDQDNGFILEDYPDEDHTRVDGFFMELADRMTRELDGVGLPLCKGYCMAINPLWRKTASQWVRQIDLWGRKHNFVAIRLSDIFFDFQSVYGDVNLAIELRNQVAKMIAANHFYLSAMFSEIADHNVALGFFGGFITDDEEQEFKGQINLKHTGTLPMVEAIRLLSLREAITEAATLSRIEALHLKGILDETERETLAAAFELLTGILLDKQISDFKEGKHVGYHVDPETLSGRQQKRLTEALKIIDDLRKRVKSEFTADIF